LCCANSSHHIFAARLEASLAAPYHPWNLACRCCLLSDRQRARSFLFAQQPLSPGHHHPASTTMSDLAGRKVFKVGTAADERCIGNTDGRTGVQPGIHRRRALQCDQGAGPGRIRHRLVGPARGQAHTHTHADCVHPVRRPTTRRAKAWPSKRSPMSSARRSWPSAPCARSSCCSTSEVRLHCIRRLCHMLTMRRAQERRTTPRDSRSAHMLEHAADPVYRLPVSTTWTYPVPTTSTNATSTRVRLSSPAT
jgi:hypothetical protein